MQDLVSDHIYCRIYSRNSAVDVVLGVTLNTKGVDRNSKHCYTYPTSCLRLLSVGDIFQSSRGQNRSSVYLTIRLLSNIKLSTFPKRVIVDRGVMWTRVNPGTPTDTVLPWRSVEESGNCCCVSDFISTTTTVMLGMSRPARDGCNRHLQIEVLVRFTA